MKIQNIKIGTRLNIGFGVIIILTFSLGLFSLREIQKISDLTVEFYNHPFTVSNAVRIIKSNTLAMHSSILDILMSDSQAEKLDLIDKINNLEKETFAQFEIIDRRFLGNKEHIKNAHGSFVRWKSIRDDVLELFRKGQGREKGLALYRKEGKYVNLLLNEIQIIVDFAGNKAKEFHQNSKETNRDAGNLILISLILVTLMAGAISFIIQRSINKPLSEVVDKMQGIAEGDLKSQVLYRGSDEVGVLSESFRTMQASLLIKSDFARKVGEGDFRSEIKGFSNKDELAHSLNVMAKNLRQAFEENQRQNWLKTGQNELANILRGEHNVQELSQMAVTFIAEYLQAQIGALFLAFDETGSDLNGRNLRLLASYAFTRRKNLVQEIKSGEGLVGQAMLEKKPIQLSNVPEDYIRVSSALGDAPPRNIIVYPLVLRNEVVGVIELGSLREFASQNLEFLQLASESIAIALEGARSRTRMKQLLEKTQIQKEELQVREEELNASNEELKEQTELLEESETKLKTQHEELQVINEELEEKTGYLENQQKEINQKNIDLEIIQRDLEKKARELEKSSKYKSEFLANMSHELRTPLNSILILAQDMARDKNKYLSKEDQEAAEIIYKSGRDLLELINDILDLSKIESGRMDVHLDEVKIRVLADNIYRNFHALAKEKKLDLAIHIDENLPKFLRSDKQKLDQIIKNLLANAFKFTKQGNVEVRFHRPADNEGRGQIAEPRARIIAISVKDTGVGIPPDKKEEIFHAFKQADGSISRIYGGTGLGLTISRNLADLMGGHLGLESDLGQGSCFTLYIPENYSGAVDREKNKDGNTQLVSEPVVQLSRKKNMEPVLSIPDDRDNLEKNDRLILVIEDDVNFARVLKRICHEKKFKCIHAADGKTGLDYATQYKPDAIFLDIRLPEIDGWGVLEALKDNTATRHIPVHIMSVEDRTLDAFKKGAIGYVTKPIEDRELLNTFTEIEGYLARKIKELLVIEDDDNTQKAVARLLGNGDIKITQCKSGTEALTRMGEKNFDCIILDLMLPDISGFDFLEKINTLVQSIIPPVIIYSAKELSREEEFKLREYAESIIIKGVKSEERLLDETALFLHRMIEKLPEHKRKIIEKLHDRETMLQGKRILLVDDDMRNVFAISRVLEEKGLEVYKAANGQIALEILEKESHMDMVLMDIMMPVMDGYETMEKIRKQEKFWNLPIIALTAKAMEMDRQKCIEAGANDYLPKPIDLDRLLSLMRVWLYK